MVLAPGSALALTMCHIRYDEMSAKKLVTLLPAELAGVVSTVNQPVPIQNTHAARRTKASDV